MSDKEKDGSVPDTKPDEKDENTSEPGKIVGSEFEEKIENMAVSDDDDGNASGSESLGEEEYPDIPDPEIDEGAFSEEKVQEMFETTFRCLLPLEMRPIDTKHYNRYIKVVCTCLRELETLLDKPADIVDNLMDKIRNDLVVIIRKFDAQIQLDFYSALGEILRSLTALLAGDSSVEVDLTAYMLRLQNVFNTIFKDTKHKNVNVIPEYDVDETLSQLRQIVELLNNNCRLELKGGESLPETKLKSVIKRLRDLVISPFLDTENITECHTIVTHCIELHCVLEHGGIPLNDLHCSTMLMITETIKMMEEKYNGDIVANEAHKAHQLGNEHYRKGEYEQALRLYTTSLELSHKEEVYNNRAQVYIHLTNYTMARADCEKVIEMNRENWKAWWRLGLANMNLGKKTEAKEALVESLKYNPNNTSAREQLQKLDNEVDSEPPADSKPPTIDDWEQELIPLPVEGQPKDETFTTAINNLLQGVYSGPPEPEPTVEPNINFVLEEQSAKPTEKRTDSKVTFDMPGRMGMGANPMKTATKYPQTAPKLPTKMADSSKQKSKQTPSPTKPTERVVKPKEEVAKQPQTKTPTPMKQPVKSKEPVKKETVKTQKQNPRAERSQAPRQKRVKRVNKKCELYRDRGVFALLEGEDAYDDALDHFNKSIEISQSASALLYRAHTYYQLRMWMPVITDTDTIITLNTDPALLARAYFYNAMANKKKKNKDKASESAGKCLFLDKDDEDYKEQLLKEFGADLKGVRVESPKSETTADICSARGVFALLGGDDFYDDALDQFNKSAELSQSAPALLYRAYTYYQLRMWMPVITDTDTIITLNADVFYLTRAYFYNAFANKKKKNKEKASESAGKCLFLDKDDEELKEELLKEFGADLKEIRVEVPKAEPATVEDDGDDDEEEEGVRLPGQDSSSSSSMEVINEDEQASAAQAEIDEKYEAEKEKADKLLAEGDLEESVLSYTRAIHIKPTKEAYNNRSICYMKLNLIPEAVLDVDKANELAGQGGANFVHIDSDEDEDAPGSDGTDDLLNTYDTEALGAGGQAQGAGGLGGLGGLAGGLGGLSGLGGMGQGAEGGLGALSGLAGLGGMGRGAGGGSENGGNTGKVQCAQQ